MTGRMTGLAAIVIVGAGLAAAALLPGMHPAGPAAIGGPFTLTDGAGHSVSDTDYAGRWRLVYFGYTHCPDACPATLGTIGAALDRMTADQRKKIVVLFITVDPARDTPAVMGAYVKAFGPEFVGLTGADAALAPVEQRFHVYAARHPLKAGDYAMDHSSIVYVMDPQGRFSAILEDGMAPAAMAARLAQLGL